jgi:ubiquitin-like modifier-activating enzyme ATG7
VDGAIVPEHGGLRLTSDESTALVDSVQTWRYGVDARQWGFFLAKRVRSSHPEGSCGGDPDEGTDARPITPGTPGTPGLNLGFAWAVGSLADYENGFFNGTYPEDRFICFADPSTWSSYPGWMLRNLLVLVRRRWKLDRAQILCYREIHARRHEARSLILRIKTDISNDGASSLESTPPSPTPEMPKVTGWEKNAKGKYTGKIANLGEYMDPQR